MYGWNARRVLLVVDRKYTSGSTARRPVHTADNLRPVCLGRPQPPLTPPGWRHPVTRSLRNVLGSTGEHISRDGTS